MTAEPPAPLPASALASFAPAGSPALPFMTALWNVWQALSARGEQALRERHGLDLRAFIALSHVQAAATHPAELARTLGVPRYEVSRVLGDLEARGAVSRSTQPGAGRRVVVNATPQGRALWHAALVTLDAVTAPALGALGPEHAHLTALLDRVAQAAQGERP